MKLSIKMPPGIDWQEIANNPIIQAVVKAFPGSIPMTYREGLAFRMTDPTDAEFAAMEACVEPMGEYLDSEGVTDLAAMTEEQMMTMIEVICTSYVDALGEAMKKRFPNGTDADRQS